MSTTTKAFKAPLALTTDTADGALTAVISTFGVIDKDGDVVLPGAFPDGAEVALCSWGHKWDQLPVGRGTISQDTERAYFTGQFFLDTADGLNTYRTVKQLGALQEYSYGFQIADAFPGEQDGQPVRMIRKFARVFEASPVLVGAGEETGTLSLKGHAPDPEAWVKALAEWLAATKEGRPISEARRARLGVIADQLESGAGDLRAMLAETAPVDVAGKALERRAAALAWARWQFAELSA